MLITDLKIMSVFLKIIFSYFPSKIYALGAQKNHLNEMVF